MIEAITNGKCHYDYNDYDTQGVAHHIKLQNRKGT